MSGVSKGNRPLNKKKSAVSLDTLHCMCCNKELNAKEFYDSDSKFYQATGKVPYCKDCLEKFYQDYLKQYTAMGYLNPDRKVIERICMLLDLYYNDKIFDSAVSGLAKEIADGKDSTMVSMYFRRVKLYQYRDKSYDTTIAEKYNSARGANSTMSIYTDEDSDSMEIIAESQKLFGSGFENDDYIELYNQYCDWTARHECNTKAQEEVFKNICLTQLQLSKAIKTGNIGDAKDLSVQLQKWLDTGKLQPKQNSGDAVSDAQTFGTLIDKWENTRPIPEIDEELRDVDKIGQYIDVFFRGHLSKMMNLKNAFSDRYDKFMKKYTVDKPEYNADENNEALFDAIFGHDLEDE